MSDLKNETRTQYETSQALHSRPQRQTERKNVFLLLLIAGVVLIVGGVMVAWLVFARQSAPAPSQAGEAPAASSTSSAQPTKSGSGDPQIYYDTVKQEVAQKLHMSVEQVTVKLQADRSASLTGLAAQQGITPAQKRAILIDAEQKGHDVLVQEGVLTQQQSEQGMQNIETWSLTQLDQHTKYYFLDH